MSITAQYEWVEVQPYAPIVTTAEALAGATLLPGGGHADATLSWWAYQTTAGPLVQAGHQVGVAAYFEIITDAVSGTRLWLWDDSGGNDGYAWQAHGALLNQWVHWAVVIDQSGAGQIRMYRNGVAMASVTMALAGWAPRTIAGDAINFLVYGDGTEVLGSAVKNIHVHSLALTAAQILAIAGAGNAHNLRFATGAWTLVDPGVVAWEIEAAGAYVPNTGTGGASRLNVSTGAASRVVGVGNALITASYQRLVAGGAAVEAATNLAARTLVPVGTDGCPSGGTVSWWEWQPSTVEEDLRLGSASEPTMVMTTADGADVDFFDDNDVLDQNINAALTPVYGRWVHYAITFDSVDFKARVYRDGYLVGSAVL